MKKRPPVKSKVITTKTKPKSAIANRKGILAGGNWIIDQVKMVDVYPHAETLANIRTQSKGTGGSPFNVLIDLARMGAKFPLSGAGIVGKDNLGDEILDLCKTNGISTKHLSSSKKAATSYTDVMTEEKSGRRTFFHCRGANALWDGSDIDFNKHRAKIFHLGYLLLLDALEESDSEHVNKGAALLAKAQSCGVKTSIDVVSEDSDRFKEVIAPALEHTDYCIINEIEAGNVTGFKIRDAKGELDTVSVKHSAGALLQMGVAEIVVIHFPEGCFARTRDGKDFWQTSLKLPKKYIVGSAGAGDAFCAGVLYGIHESWDYQKALLLGVCAAAATLASPTCTDGILTVDGCLALAKKYKPRKPLEPDY
ncbi:carbohydrate kinase family protein [Verrucomicrobia bacterium]|nr:carbohydrate kinase family protein [Verrucomicrobiota bacterium]